jgi:U3 small nucleolar ribonucleoprotein component
MLCTPSHAFKSESLNIRDPITILTEERQNVLEKLIEKAIKTKVFESYQNLVDERVCKFEKTHPEQT